MLIQAVAREHVGDTGGVETQDHPIVGLSHIHAQYGVRHRQAQDVDRIAKLRGGGLGRCGGRGQQQEGQQGGTVHSASVWPRRR